MKKIVFILAIAGLALASCTQFKPETTDKNFKKPVAPFVVITEQTETSISFQVNPAEKTLWFAYTVLEGEASASVSGSKILSIKTGGLAEDCLEYSKSGDIVVDIDDLERGTTYTIYTVSTSEIGVESEVRTYEFTTEDTELPSVVETATEEEIFQVLFSEDVILDEQLEPTGACYAINDLNGAVKEVDVLVEVEGNIATFTVVNEMFPGSYYTIDCPEGLFVDANGNKLPAITSTITGEEEPGKPKGKGFIGHISNENFNLEIYGGEPVEIVTDLMSPIWIAVPKTFIYAKYDNTLPGSIVYDYTSPDGAHSVTTYPFANFPNYGWNGTYNCALTYPNVKSYTGRPDPTPGSYLTITIPEGFLIDIYGNVSNEFVIGPFLYAFDFTLDDILGTYVQSGESMFGSSYDESDFDITIAESDDAELGNIMITSFYGFDGIKIYGTFVETTGSVVFHAEQTYIGYGVDNEKGKYYEYYIDGCDGKSFIDDVTFNITQAGILSSEEMAWGVIYDIYNIPEGGISEITDEDYVDYDYNFFYVDATLKSNGTNSISPLRLSSPKGHVNKGEKIAFERKCKK